MTASRLRAGSEFMVKRRASGSEGVKARLRPLAALHICGRHLQRWLPGPPGGRDRARPLRRRRDWEGTYVDEHDPNLLTDLPKAVLNWPDYLASRIRSDDSTAAKNFLAAGYPPDIVPTPRLSVLAEPLRELVLGSDACASGRSGWTRPSTPMPTMALPTTTTTRAFRSPTSVRTWRPLRRPEDPAPLDHRRRDDGRASADRPSCARVCAARRSAAGRSSRQGPWPCLGGAGSREPQYRLYEVQNGNHIETYQDTLPAARADHAARAEGVRPARAPCRTAHAAATRPVHRPRRPHRRAPRAAGRCAQLFVP